MTGFSPKTRQVIQDRSQGICEICGIRPVQQHHHRRPRGMGSSRRADTNTPANAIGACEPDHRYIEANRSEALEKGWLVRQGHSPEDTFMLYRGEWAYLTVDGGVEYLKDMP